MLIIKAIGVALAVGSAIKWKRIRLPLLVLLGLLLILRSSCGHERPIKSHDMPGPKPAFDTRQMAPIDGGAGDTDGPVGDECPGDPTCGPGR